MARARKVQNTRTVCCDSVFPWMARKACSLLPLAGHPRRFFLRLRRSKSDRSSSVPAEHPGLASFSIDQIPSHDLVRSSSAFQNVILYRYLFRRRDLPLPASNIAALSRGNKGSRGHRFWADRSTTGRQRCSACLSKCARQRIWIAKNLEPHKFRNHKGYV